MSSAGIWFGGLTLYDRDSGDKKDMGMDAKPPDAGEVLQTELENQ